MSAEPFVWKMADDFDSKPHKIGDEKCNECCCYFPEKCEDCGGLTHGEPDEWDGEHHASRCDRPCDCVYCPPTEDSP